MRDGHTRRTGQFENRLGCPATCRLVGWPSLGHHSSLSRYSSEQGGSKIVSNAPPARTAGCVGWPTLGHHSFLLT